MRLGTAASAIIHGYMPKEILMHPTVDVTFYVTVALIHSTLLSAMYHLGVCRPSQAAD